MGTEVIESQNIYTGRPVIRTTHGWFDLNRPEFDIYDIAHSLSMNCRYNGHTEWFYSVAEHSVLVARQNMLRRNYQGTILRTRGVLEKYPNYSEQDLALFLTAQAYEKKKELPKAGFYYGVLVSYHPLSPMVEESRRRLEVLNLPIPEVNQEALAHARAEQEVSPKQSFMGRMGGLFSKNPDISSTRKATRPPIPLIPKPVDASASSGGSTSPAATTGPAADVSSGVSVEIIKQSGPKSQTASPRQESPDNATPKH